MSEKYKALEDCSGLHVSDIRDTIIELRGIKKPKEFFNPGKKNLIPLDKLKNIKAAAERVIRAVDNDEKIGVLYDVDTDGIMSGTIMTRYLRESMEYNPLTFINNGKSHGVLESDIEKYSGLELLIIVDSLNKDVSLYKILKEKGVDIIILDHHVINPKINYSDYVTLVSSQDEYGNKALSGSGVTWKFCKFIDKLTGNDSAEDLIDLAACGIVADMMDMNSLENRYIVNKGLKRIRNKTLDKLLGSYEFNSSSISYSIAPMINASNRMDNNEIALKAFLSDNSKEISKYIKELTRCKVKQNQIVNDILPFIEDQCRQQIDHKVIIVMIDSIYGISGLLANKLLDKYKRPIIVVKDTCNDYSGSMRSIGVLDFREFCNNSKLARAMGHEQASGIIIPKNNLNKFLDYIEKELPALDTQEEIVADIQLEIEDVTKELVNEIKQINRISGTGFKPIKVLIKNVINYDVKSMSEGKHLLICPSEELQIIKWNFAGSFEEYEEASMFNEEIQFIATLDSGFFARKLMLKAICDSIQIGSAND